MKNVVNLTIDISDDGNISLSLGEILKENTPTYLYRTPINRYINLFNESNSSTTNKLIFGKSFKVNLSYYSNKYLFSNKHGRAKDGLCYSFNGYEDSEESLTIYDRPTIHLTYGDIFQEYIEPYKRYARYMDSSIWNYYVPVLVVDEKAIELDENGKIRPKLGRYDFIPLERALNEIISNYLNNRYQLRVAREYAHLFSRIVNQSFLPDISGHGKNVSPYLFHSERKSSEDLKKGEHIEILSEIKQYKWRFLLVDDHSTEKMAVEGNEEETITKLDVVKEEIKRLFIDKIIATEKDYEDTKKNATIYIECASSIKEAKEKLEKKKYEIILLDYLLGKKDGRREYGYELLDWIYKQEKVAKGDRSAKHDYKKGPDNRFYFMFISAFTTAVSERLLTEGWARSEKYWYIGEGACPINTPYLFQYRLLHIMQRRMEKMGISILSDTENDKFRDSKIYKDVIAKIFPEDKDKNKGGKIRKYANDKFQDVLSLLYHYKNLLVDTQITTTIFDTKESVLATDFVMKNPNIGGLLEHLTQLVYLTAFGTVRQWPEMWEEYQFIKSIIGQPIGAIEEYIVNLKNNDL